MHKKDDKFTKTLKKITKEISVGIRIYDNALEMLFWSPLNNVKKTMLTNTVIYTTRKHCFFLR